MNALIKFTIDPEFKSLLPLVSGDSGDTLESLLIKDGCRDPLVVWDGLLIDGHRRYEICTRLAIPFQVVEIDLPDRESAKIWAIKTQFTRRNLTPDQMSYFRGMVYNDAKQKQGAPEGNQNRSIQRDQSDPIESTAEKLADELGVSAPTIKRDGKFAEAVDALGLQQVVATGELTASKSAVVEAAKPIIELKKEHEKWEAESKASPLIPLPEPPPVTSEIVQKARAHVANNSGENEWYTPEEFIESARHVLGSIDCDPASSEIANLTVNASVFFTKEDDGLSRTWNGNVWLNPPYAQPLIANFSEAVSHKFETGEIIAAIVLVNNATETTWFQRMASVSSAICFPRRRIRFLDPKGIPGAPLQGQAVLYLGADPRKFTSEFREHGSVYYG